MKKEYLIYKLADEMKGSVKIDMNLFRANQVKRGLRNEDGTGVLVGLTNIGNVVGRMVDGEGNKVPVEGELYYRGYEISELVGHIIDEKRLGFEEVAYLLLSGRLPDREELDQFHSLIFENMPLEPATMLHIIELEGKNIMNILSRSVLELYTYDANPDDTSRENLMRQSIELISKFPTIIAYAYNVLRHKEQGRSLHIRHPWEQLSFAENFLHMLKRDYTELDARTLDLLLIVHAEHGGGNNSTFTVRLSSSSGTDTYSSIAAGIGSLKGPLHGGANIKVRDMLEFMKGHIPDWSDENRIRKTVRSLIKGEIYDRRGLVYGIGHAVYTISDPRARLLKRMARDLAVEKDRLKEFEFMERIERIAVEEVAAMKGKVVCANVDFYSGFVYDLIGLPVDIYTPLFAMARIVGWCAHRNEELNYEGRRIIRPAYKCVVDSGEYLPLADR